MAIVPGWVMVDSVTGRPFGPEFEPDASVNDFLDWWNDNGEQVVADNFPDLVWGTPTEDLRNWPHDDLCKLQQLWWDSVTLEPDTQD